jgi:hypothetical protein
MIGNHPDAFSAKVASTTQDPVWFAPGGVFRSLLISDPEWPNSASTLSPVQRRTTGPRCAAYAVDKFGMKEAAN